VPEACTAACTHALHWACHIDLFSFCTPALSPLTSSLHSFSALHLILPSFSLCKEGGGAHLTPACRSATATCLGRAPLPHTPLEGLHTSHHTTTSHTHRTGKEWRNKASSLHLSSAPPASHCTLLWEFLCLTHPATGYSPAPPATLCLHLELSGFTCLLLLCTLPALSLPPADSHSGALTSFTPAAGCLLTALPVPYGTATS